jgi:hypothetical protein
MRLYWQEYLPDKYCILFKSSRPVPGSFMLIIHNKAPWLLLVLQNTESSSEFSVYSLSTVSMILKWLMITALNKTPDLWKLYWISKWISTLTGTWPCPIFEVPLWRQQLIWSCVKSSNNFLDFLLSILWYCMGSFGFLHLWLAIVFVDYIPHAIVFVDYIPFLVLDFLSSCETIWWFCFVVYVGQRRRILASFLFITQTIPCKVW